MMASLPSFVELMSSLGLEDEASYPEFTPAYCRPRSLSSASSSSAQDDDRASPRPSSTRSGQYLLVPARYNDPRDRTDDHDAPRVSAQGKGRYSPYSAAAIPRRVSLPVLYSEADVQGRPNLKRPISTSPLHGIAAPSQRAMWVTKPARTERSRRGSQTWSKESDLDSVTPISTYVRRKSPHSPSVSPTTPSFPRSVSDNSSAPVAIPALPTLLPSFFQPSPTLPSSNLGGPDRMPLDVDSRHFRSDSKASNIQNGR
ncbi:hypothetical protein BV25DRAFT_72865 [Artomyces pyxidatus]|uniref:Uncharacterized protein n=1 Tax=Artomyces pyxidatus TaxID=48021 RepID=A0ACB8TKV9_9AGAM|nr:hypothetical protein BV25DRAFT_72865 [Artomyces pyxidatus]